MAKKPGEVVAKAVRKKAIDRKYTGALATPITCRPLPKTSAAVESLFDLPLEQTYKYKVKAWQSETASITTIAKIQKLGALLDHYSISKDDPERWFLLALALADAHVPGFSISNRKPGGRGLEWDDSKLAQLFYAVRKTMQRLEFQGRSCTESHACSVLAKSDPWKLDKTAKTLYNRYKESQSSTWVALFARIGDDPRVALSADEACEMMMETIRN